jgi:signal transduction histidine kinase
MQVTREALAGRSGDDGGPTVHFVPRMHVTLRLDHRVAVELYRIAQEATTNALRHSRAKRIEIVLESTDAATSLTIDDDGLGLPADVAAREGMGISIMRYRAHAIGTELAIGARPGGGMRVACVVRRERTG